MRSGAAAHHRGFFHETALYGSDDELLDIVVPFLCDGVQAGEPVIVTFDEHNAALTRSALADAAGITFLPGVDQHSRPATTIRAYRELYAGLMAGGASQIRVVGDVPHPGVGMDWHGWARYEAVVNHAFDDFPIWGMCPYDTRITPDDVLDDVMRTHPHIATSAGAHEANPRFEAPLDFLAGLLAPDPTWRLPDTVLVDPTVRAARLAAKDAAVRASLSEHQRDTLALAVSELVANALSHGAPPVTVETWIGERHIDVAVTDGGDGPSDPFVGLLRPPPDAEGGFGLWIVHQVCDGVTLAMRDGRFVARASIGVRVRGARPGG